MRSVPQSAAGPAAALPPRGMTLCEYDYELPPELIAQSRLPAGERSRLLVVDRSTGALTVASTRDLPEYLRAGDLLVRNDTRVLRARLRGVRTRAKAGPGVPPAALEVEVLLCHPLGAGHWEALVKPAKRVRPGDCLEFIDGTRAEVDAAAPQGMRRLRFADEEAAFTCMDREGLMPVPPYVHQKLDRPEDYQTSYAAVPGAVAAPTAGFHFGPEDFDAMRARGVEVLDVTLHVGPGTFQPIRHEDLGLHEMHREQCVVAPGARQLLERARASQRRIVALGTTTVRVLESLAAGVAGAGESFWTNLFIGPCHQFRSVGAMITNFHLPRTSLLVMVSAFGGLELVRRAYALAVDERFRFYSFGDGMLIL